MFITVPVYYMTFFLMTATLKLQTDRTGTAQDYQLIAQTVDAPEWF